MFSEVLLNGQKGAKQIYHYSVNAAIPRESVMTVLCFTASLTCLKIAKSLKIDIRNY